MDCTNHSIRRGQKRAARGELTRISNGSILPNFRFYLTL
ncbi:hypothetical protein FRUB_05834 [Fimbriiglobus ruber]|uniref:Uncharacterized protein n=1 Tax=Fimbriiglobus ruber TaxID=1908690 RepID=A0A225DJR0_9BACT|nr:hypothetical protein FRUB_05834 [Fimbriiglobus ruber]